MKKQRADIQDQENKKKTQPKGVYYQYKHDCVLQVKIIFRIRYSNQGRSMGRGQVSPLCPKKSKHARIKVEYKNSPPRALKQ